jgi:hypothetical protein
MAGRIQLFLKDVLNENQGVLDGEKGYGME